MPAPALIGALVLLLAATHLLAGMAGYRAGARDAAVDQSTYRLDGASVTTVGVTWVGR